MRREQDDEGRSSKWGEKINEKGRKYEESREWKDKDNIEDRK